LHSKVGNKNGSGFVIVPFVQNVVGWLMSALACYVQKLVGLSMPVTGRGCVKTKKLINKFEKFSTLYC
jgi:hypothetical protein